MQNKPTKTLRIWTDSDLEQMLQPLEHFRAEATPLMSAEALRERAKQELDQELQDDVARFDAIFTQGLDTVVEELPQLITEEEWTSVRQDFLGMGDRLSQYQDKLASGEATGKEMAFPFQVFGISRETIKHLETLADAKMKEIEWEQARSVWTILCFLAPVEPSYWVGISKCYLYQHKLAEAEEALRFAQTMNPKGIAAAVYLSLLYRVTGDKKRAQDQLDHLDELTAQDPEAAAGWKEMREEIIALHPEEGGD